MRRGRGEWGAGEWGGGVWCVRGNNYRCNRFITLPSHYVLFPLSFALSLSPLYLIRIPSCYLSLSFFMVFLSSLIPYLHAHLPPSFVSSPSFSFNYPLHFPVSFLFFLIPFSSFLLFSFLLMFLLHFSSFSLHSLFPSISFISSSLFSFLSSSPLSPLLFPFVSLFLPLLCSPPFTPSPLHPPLRSSAQS